VIGSAFVDPISFQPVEILKIQFLLNISYDGVLVLCMGIGERVESEPSFTFFDAMHNNRNNSSSNKSFLPLHRHSIAPKRTRWGESSGVMDAWAVKSKCGLC
jgi:hypothetical protein